MRQALFLLICLISTSGFAQKRKQIRSVDSSYYAAKIDSLKKLSGRNKKIPAKYRLAVLYTLSHFPKLDSTRIQFKKAKIKTSVNVRPQLFSLLFKKKHKQCYIIRINTSDKNGTIRLNEVPFNASVGLFGHEFSHIIDYSEKNIVGLLGRLLAYTNRITKEKYEKEIDRMTIQRGLGWQLYDWSYFVLHESDASENYKEFKKKVYLEPEEIKAIIQKHKKKSLKH